MRDRNITILTKIVQYTNEISGTISRFGLDFDKFENDYVAKNAISMCVLQIGELVNALSDEFKEKYSKILWREIVSLRNRTAHAYISIDWDILWGIAIKDVPELKLFCEQLINDDADE
jgi:uncharacterized protein with HEPN domain